MKRTRISRLLYLTALAVIGVLFSSSVIWAQTAPPAADTLKVNYFSNANTAGAPDATVYVSNPGTSAPTGICAMVFVLDAFQELRECCGCSLSPDSLRTFSVNGDLVSNSNTPGTLTTGTIKIVSGNGYPTCNPTKFVPTPAIRAWATHIQMPPGFGPSITEADFQDATLSTAEVTKLTRICGSIMHNSSGYGVCSCGVGD